MIPDSVSTADHQRDDLDDVLGRPGRPGRRFNRIPPLFSFHHNKMSVSLPLGERYHVGVRKTGHLTSKDEGNGKRWGACRLFNEQKEAK